jgi:hypothetical protein
MSKHVPKRLFEINSLTKQGYAKVFVPYVSIPNVTILNVTILTVTILKLVIIPNIYTNPERNPKRH